jgi:hypothetical protein
MARDESAPKRKKKNKKRAVLSIQVRGGKKARKRARKFLKQFDVFGLL